MLALLVLVTKKLGHSDFIVVGATEAGDKVTVGDDGMMDGICVRRVFPE
jgi:hypothetical protein